MAHSSHPHPRSLGRARRAVAVVGATLGGVVTFSIAAAGGAMLHLNVPPARRFVAHTINRVLADSFQGTLRIEHFAHIGFKGIDDLSLTLFDPEANPALRIEHASVRIQLLTLVRSVLSSRGDINLVVPSLYIDHIEAALEQNQAGELNVQRAFASRHPTPPPPPDKPARGLALTMPQWQLAHAWVHGHVNALPVLDAELANAQGAVNYSSAGTTFQLHPLRVTVRGLTRAAATVTLTAQGQMPSAPGADMQAQVHVDGSVGSVRALVQASIQGKQLDVVADVPQTQPEAWQAIAEGIPIHEPLTVHAEAHGALPTLTPTARVQIGGHGLIELEGNVRLQETTQADVTLKTSRINARAFSATAPKTDVSSFTKVSVTRSPNGALRGEYDLSVEPSRLNDQTLPRTRVSGHFTQTSINGKADIYEPGVNAQTTFALRAEGASPSPNALDFEALVEAPELARVPRLAPGAHGRMRVHAQGKARLDQRILQTRVEADLGGVTYSNASVEHASVEAQVGGSLDRLMVQGALQAQGVAAAGHQFSNVALGVQGPMASPLITASLQGPDVPRINARAAIQTEHGTSIRDVQVALARQDVTVVAKASTIRLRGGTVDVEDFTLEGAGEPVHASVHMRSGGINIKTNATDVDLGRIARLLGQPPVEGAHASWDVDLLSDKTRGTRGHARADMHDVAYSFVKGASTHVNVAFKENHIDGDVQASWGDAANFSLRASDITLSGHDLWNAASWRGARGAMELKSTMDLAKLSALIPQDLLPVDQAAGVIHVQAALSREAVSAAPNVDLKASTQGLTLTGKTASQASDNAAQTPWKTADMDAELQVKVDGAQDHTELSARLVDQRGTLIAFSGDAHPPLTQFLADPTRATREALLAIPIRAHLAIPERALDTLPPLIRPAALRGNMGLTADIEGTAQAPHLTVHARAQRLEPTTEHGTQPVNVEAQASYDGAQGQVQVQVLRPEGAMLATASSAIQAKASDLWAPNTKGQLAWEASGEVRLSNFPLQSIPKLREMQIKGLLNGTIALQGLHRDARLTGTLETRDLHLGHASFQRGVIGIETDAQTMRATTQWEQTDGSLKTQAYAGIHWGGALVPSLDATKPLEALVQAKRFQIAALLPFVKGQVNQLDGRLDADLHMRAEPAPAKGHVEGTLQLTGGRFEIAAMGQEFHDAFAHVDFLPGGQIKLQKLSAQGATGRVTASGGVMLEGFDLKGAKAAIRIARHDKLPITIQGVPMGKIWGDMDINAQKISKNELVVHVNIPTWEVDLPQSSSHAVQSLDSDPSIKIGVHRTAYNFSVLPLQKPEVSATDISPASTGPGTKIHTEIALGENVRVRRSSSADPTQGGTALDVYVTGNPMLDVTDKSRMSGQIRLTSGVIEAFGKRFKVQRGVVTFDPNDSSNPTVIATASWDAPAGTKVYVDFVGPVKTGKLSLRSEPPRTQNEILAILLFGSEEGSVETPSSGASGGKESETAKAAGIGGGVATAGLNRALSNVTNVEITTRVDTSESQNPRPEVAIQISPKVSAQVAYNLGLPVPGQNPDRTLLTLDYNFRRHWSVLTTGGDQGSSMVDLIWRYRY